MLGSRYATKKRVLLRGAPRRLATSEPEKLLQRRAWLDTLCRSGHHVGADHIAGSIEELLIEARYPGISVFAKQGVSFKNSGLKLLGGGVVVDFVDGHLVTSAVQGLP